MSFSSEVKEELAKQFSKSRHCQLAELAGMLEMEGSYDKASGQLRMDTDNVLLKEKYIGLVPRSAGMSKKKRHSMNREQMECWCSRCAASGHLYEARFLQQDRSVIRTNRTILRLPAGRWNRQCSCRNWWDTLRQKAKLSSVRNGMFSI